MQRRQGQREGGNQCPGRKSAPARRSLDGPRCPGRAGRRRPAAQKAAVTRRRAEIEHGPGQVGWRRRRQAQQLRPPQNSPPPGDEEPGTGCQAEGSPAPRRQVGGGNGVSPVEAVPRLPILRLVATEDQPQLVLTPSPPGVWWPPRWEGVPTDPSRAPGGPWLELAQWAQEQQQGRCHQQDAAHHGGQPAEAPWASLGRRGRPDYERRQPAAPRGAHDQTGRQQSGPQDLARARPRIRPEVPLGFGDAPVDGERAAPWRASPRAGWGCPRLPSRRGQRPELRSARWPRSRPGYRTPPERRSPPSAARLYPGRSAEQPR